MKPDSTTLIIAKLQLGNGDRRAETLPDLIRLVSRLAEKIFRRTSEIRPMWHAETATNEVFVITPERWADAEDKADTADALRQFFKESKVERYVFVTEAWILQVKTSKTSEAEIETATCQGLEHHPDRREVVMFSAEQRGGKRSLGQRYILRPEHGKPVLSPLTINKGGIDQGRLVGLLP